MRTVAQGWFSHIKMTCDQTPTRIDIVSCRTREIRRRCTKGLRPYLIRDLGSLADFGRNGDGGEGGGGINPLTPPHLPIDTDHGNSTPPDYLGNDLRFL